jgi:prevent-host-death family protein
MVNVHDAKAQLSELLERAVRGEEVVIAKRGKPFVRLVPASGREPRRPGLAKGEVTDAFFEPLSDEELAAWDQ